MKKYLFLTLILFPISLVLFPESTSAQTISDYSPTAHWQLDELSGTRLSATSTFNLTDNNTVDSVTGLLNNGAKFVRSNSESLSISDDDDLIPVSDFSFSTWVYFTSLTNGQLRPFFGQDGSASNRSFAAWHYKTSSINRFVLMIGDTGSSVEELHVNWAPSINTWYHVLATWDASTSKVELYIDGTLQGTDTGSKTSIYNGTADFYIGRFGNYSGDYTDAYMDEFTFWDGTIINSTEASEIYNSGTPLPYSNATTTATLQCVYGSIIAMTGIEGYTCNTDGSTTTCDLNLSNATPTALQVTSGDLIFGLALIFFILCLFFIGFIFNGFKKLT
jgi:hypothetical protein